ncbi:type I pullulanase [Cohnella faecalis]|uniref:pullulanase n=1 Tax=Cohnella faecalis TaxID=2315694 RepID=A0A398CVS6_9BACL|nr:type I pullulanase [Cohnella faecalis]
MRAVSAEATTELIIHYKPADKDTRDWSLWVWEDGKDGKPYKFTGYDAFGKVGKISLAGSVKKAGFIVRTEDWQKDVPGDRFIENIAGAAEIWLLPGDSRIYTSNPEEPEGPAKSFDEVKVKLHYFRYDDKYDGWNVWGWAEGKDGASYPLNGEDEYGKYAEFTVPNTKDSKRIGFVLRLSDASSDWANREFSDRFIEKINDDGTAEIWIAQNQEPVYYKDYYVDKSPKIIKAQLDDARVISFETNIPFPISGSGDEGFTLKTGDIQIPIASVKPINPDDKGVTRLARLTTSVDLDLRSSYTLVKENYLQATVTLGKIFGSASFDKTFYYAGNDLGATYTKAKTKFRVWAPTAAEAKLVVYAKWNDASGQEIAMTKAEKGTWTASLAGDQKGKFYTYKVLVNGKWNEAADPYASSVALNGDRGAIIDWAATDPKGWSTQKKPPFKNSVDAIIYELHVRDLSIAANSGIKNKGKFLGLTETGTKGPGGTKTGLDHIKDLGVTHVQLLPIYDYATVDESKLNTPQYNWGYDPKNYNAPEGSYSSNPADPSARVRELKQAVQALHQNGLRVIMDVVYNHVYSVDASNLEKLVPGYYFRYDENGKLSNGSGVNNDTASDHSMVRKLIVDSVKHWAKDYKLDGFRFDLMGIHDIETMNQVRKALDQIDPSIITIGEGWILGTALDSSLKANQPNAAKLPRIGQFNDSFRDSTKGSAFLLDQTGFVSGNYSVENSVKGGIVGGITYQPNIAQFAKSPDQSVNYVEAHDNNTLWDKLAFSNPKDSEATRIKMHKLATTVTLTSQGIPFLHAGQEFLRTKGGNGNSYNSSDAVNQLDWTRKAKYQSVVDYYKGVIALRKAHPAFRMTSAADIKKNLKFLNTKSGLIGYTIDGRAARDSWAKIAVFHNALRQPQQVTLPKGKWKIVVNGEKAGTKAISSVKGTTVTVPALSSMVLYSQ